MFFMLSKTFILPWMPANQSGPECRLASRFSAGAIAGCLAVFSVAAIAATPQGNSALSADAGEIATWVRQSADNQGLPFAILDKKQAMVYVFAPDGHLRGSSPALIGLAKGDHSVPGIGERALSQIADEEKTTPAGRFLAETGRNAKGEDILWVDYDHAVSMHRVRPNIAAERRLERLASSTPLDNRISFGCINLPVAFYNTVVVPVMYSSAPNSPNNAKQSVAHSVVYVLPETQPISAFLSTLKMGTTVSR